MKYLSQLKPSQLKNKTCLLRVDLNIEDADLSRVFYRERERGLRGLARGHKRIPLRIAAILPTIEFLLENKAKVVILSHRGRPGTRINADKRGHILINPRLNPHKSALSLRPFAEIFSGLLKRPVNFIDFEKGFNAPEISDAIARNSIFILENLRFFPEEEKNDQDFAQSLALLGDIYINDGFAVSHRANASVAAITRFLPSYVGLLLEKEIKNLGSVMKNSKKPLVIILGGAKVSDKIGLINNFLTRADYFLIGGAMANTFFASQGLPVGDSLCERDIKLTNLMSLLNRRIILPNDVAIHKGQILDIGPKTIKKFQEIIKNAGTIIWNGPMGMFEDKKFAKGTDGIAAAVLRNKKAKIIIGGGETIASLTTLMSADFKRITTDTYPRKSAKNQRESATLWVSTGGGAMMEYLAGKKLPGIAALE